MKIVEGFIDRLVLIRKELSEVDQTKLSTRLSESLQPLGVIN